MTEQTRTLDTLIDRYIVPDPNGRPDRVRITGSGAEIWALIAYLRAYSIEQTAIDYHLPREAVEAAIAYYKRHRAVIDARLTLHDAAFAAEQ